MPEILTDSERAQLDQTIEMFEVITQSQPDDYQSLEILKEAYYKLGRMEDVQTTARKIAEAYESSGQLTQAILEYESILTSYPDDKEAASALERLEQASFGGGEEEAHEDEQGVAGAEAASGTEGAAAAEGDDGRAMMEKVFVEGKVITQPDFNDSWPQADSYPPGQVVPPLVHVLADRGLVPSEDALGLLLERSRLTFLPLSKYDIDVELARTFSKDACRRWCVLPFDRMSKAVMVATANPFNKAAMADIERTTKSRIIWYLAPPEDLIKAVSAIFH